MSKEEIDLQLMKLKAAVYDNMAQIEALNNQVRALNQQISELNELANQIAVK